MNDSTDKFQTFRTIKFPIKLKNVEIYIRNYILYYTMNGIITLTLIVIITRVSNERKRTQKAFPGLQNKYFFKNGNNCFQNIAKCFQQIISLIHHDINKSLYIDVNVLR